MVRSRRGLAARLTFTFALAIVLCALMASAAFAVTAAGGVNVLAGDGNGAISGRVTGSGGVGLGGILMDVQKWDGEDWGYYGWEFRTGPDGYYTLAGLDAGLWKVTYSDQTSMYRSSVVTSITVTDPGTKTGINVTLQPAGSISGTVRDSAGKTVAGAYVQAFDVQEYPYRSMNTFTDASGRYTIRGADGDYALGTSVVIAASRDGYLARFYPAAARRDLATAISFTSGQTLTGKDVTLPEDTSAVLPGVKRLNATSSQKDYGKTTPRVAGDHVAWADDGISILTISSGVRSHIATWAEQLDIDSSYVFADDAVYDAATGAFLREIPVKGYVYSIACDDQYVAYLSTAETNTLWTYDTILTMVRLSDWSVKTCDLGADFDARLSRGAVAGGKVLVGSWSTPVIYDWATGTAQPLDIIDSLSDATFAGGKIAYVGGDGVYVRDAAGTSVTLVYGSTRSIGALASDGNGVAFYEWTYDPDTDTSSDVVLKYVDVTTKTAKTLWSAGSKDISEMEWDALDVGGKNAVWLDGWSTSLGMSMKVQRTSVDTLQTTRADAPITAPVWAWNPAIAAGRTAWIDDRLSDGGLFLKETTSSAESLISTDVAGHWDVPTLTPKHLVWTADREAGLTIRSYDLATHATKDIATGLDWNTLLIQSDGDTLFYSVDPGVDSTQRVLKQVDLTTGVSKQIATVSNVWRLAFKAGGGKLVYSDAAGAQHLVDIATGASSTLSHRLPLDEDSYEQCAFSYPNFVAFAPGAFDEEGGACGTLVSYNLSTNATTTLEGYARVMGSRPVAVSGTIAVAGNYVYDLVSGARTRYVLPAGLVPDQLAARDGGLAVTASTLPDLDTTPGIFYVPLPKPAAPVTPKVNKAAFTNPIAYELSSFLKTNFTINTDKANVTAKLTLKTAAGTVTLYNAAIPNAANTDYKLPAWDGKVNGAKLPSAAYDWTLTVTKDGLTTTRTGKVTISKILFTLNGTSKAGVAVTGTGYMIPGSANCYISAKTTAAADTFTIKLTGPSGFSLPARYWSLGVATPLSTVSYFNATSAIRYRGIHTWSMTGKTNATYSMTVIQ